MIADIHSHHPGPGRILSVDPSVDGSLPGEGPFSVGIHPWNTPAGSAAFGNLERMAESPSVVAIGETGLDRNRGGSAAEQTGTLMRHIELSERLRKPLILHVVGRWNEIVDLRRRVGPSQPWIIHGFRGKPQLARQLLREGFLLSIGERFNPESVSLIPEESLLLETDDSPTATIEKVAAAVAAVRGCPAPALLYRAAASASRIFAGT
ncbi:MAG: TatD family hydrolase [Clostridium sp.]|nr:TatD family hydrolase [Clostridium sp.]